MKKAAIIVVLLTIVATGANAQYVRGDNKDSVTGQPKPPAKPYNFWEHTSLGGNFGLQFGTITFVGISPLLNYHFTENVIVGAGPIYQYYRDNDYNYSSSMYGGRVAAVAYLPGTLKNIFVMGEYDIINVPYYNYLTNADSRATVGIPMAGGGYRQPIGDRMYFTIAALWVLSNVTYSPYQNPVILAGLDIGL